MKNFIVAGGGTAGWMTAAVLSSIYYDSKITVIENSDIGTIGVGESTTPVILDFLSLCNINLLEFMQHTDSTIKVGINFENWTNRDKKYFQGNRDYLHSFDLHKQQDDYWGVSYLYDFLEDGHRYDSYVQNNSVPFTKQGKQIGTHALHINAVKLVEYLKNFLKNKVTVIDALITTVDIDQNGIKSLILDDTRQISADFYFDCTGFKKVLHSKFHSEWQSMQEVLPVNRALPTPFVWNDPMNTTHASALDAGWAWQVPLTNRVGSGYVYSDEFIKNPQEEFQNFILKKYNIKVEPSKIIKFETGFVKNPWTHNVVTIGLSSGFVEPLESTSIHMIFHQIMSFTQLYDGIVTEKISRMYNNYMIDMFEDTVAFIKLHYLGGRNDTEFWRYIHASKNTERLDYLLDVWKFHFPSADHIGQNRDRTIGYRIFALPAWIQVLFGVKKINKDLIKKYLDFNNISKVNKEKLDLLTQKEFLNILNKR